MNVDLKFVFCTMVFLVASVMRWFDKIPAPEWSSMTMWVVVGYVFGVAAVKVAEGWSVQAVAKAKLGG